LEINSGASQRRSIALDVIERRLLSEWGIAYGQQWDEIRRQSAACWKRAAASVKFRNGVRNAPAGSEPAAAGLPPLVIGEGPLPCGSGAALTASTWAKSMVALFTR